MPDRSAATLRLRHVTFDLTDVRAYNSADETAAGFIHLHRRKGFDTVRFLRGISKVNLAQCNVSISRRHLLQGWRDHSAWGAPLCPEIHKRHLARHGRIGLTTGHRKRRKTEN